MGSASAGALEAGGRQNATLRRSRQKYEWEKVIGRVRRYKLVPMLWLLVSLAGVVTLAWRAGAMTTLELELTLIVIGAGFGPLPSITAVAMQNVVARHQLGISVGTMNFSRNLFATMLIAVFGAIVLAGAPAGQALVDAVQAGAPQAAEAFGRVFLAAAASLCRKVRDEARCSGGKASTTTAKRQAAFADLRNGRNRTGEN